MRWGLFWLEGPLQSWGHDSRFDRRETLPFPTRSGILGMMNCAMGEKGERREWLDSMRQLRQTVVAYARNGVPEPSLLMDFHMVGSGYDSKDAWQSLMVPRKISGEKSSTAPHVTRRFYIQDMAFACAIELPDDNVIEHAMKYPVGPICLGRKNCIPSDLVWRGSFLSQDAALGVATIIAGKKNRHEILRVSEDADDGGEIVTLRDVPIVFGICKTYESRRVCVK